MSDDWDVIEELEFWDDYAEFYGPQRPTRRQAKKMAKAKAQQQKEAERKQKEMIRKEVSRQLNQKSTPSVSPTDGTGCLVTVLTVVIVIVLIAVGLF